MRPLREVRVGAFGRSFPCFETGDPRTGSGLVGIDLDTKPGRHVATVAGLDANGKAVTADHPATVAPKTFATRSPHAKTDSAGATGTPIKAPMRGKWGR